MCLTPTGRFTVVEGRLEPKVRASTLWIHHKKYNDKCRRVLEIFDEGKWKVLAAVDMPEEESSKPFWVTYGTTKKSEIRDAYNNGELVLCKHDDKIYRLVAYSEADDAYIFHSYNYEFGSTVPTTLFIITVNDANIWEEHSQIVPSKENFWAIFEADTYEDVAEAINTNTLLGCIYQEIVTDQETSSTRLIRKYFNLESFDEDSQVITFSAMIEGVYKKLTLTTTGWSEA